jgi:hypothetical protein
MRSAVIMDCEYLTAEGAMSRMWCGPNDPDPTVAQIGLVRIGLDDGFPVLAELCLHVVPRDRRGQQVALDPYFIGLTGVTEDMIAADGLLLADALEQVRCFADGSRIWSWGKDELYMMAVSCYVEGIRPPLPATQFGNATRLLLAAGMTPAEVASTRSSQLSARFGLDHAALRAHDALDDARSVALALQHLLRQGALIGSDLA